MDAYGRSAQLKHVLSSLKSDSNFGAERKKVIEESALINKLKKENQNLRDENKRLKGDISLSRKEIVSLRQKLSECQSSERKLKNEIKKKQQEANILINRSNRPAPRSMGTSYVSQSNANQSRCSSALSRVSRAESVASSFNASPARSVISNSSFKQIKSSMNHYNTDAKSIRNKPPVTGHLASRAYVPSRPNAPNPLPPKPALHKNSPYNSVKDSQKSYFPSKASPSLSSIASPSLKGRLETVLTKSNQSQQSKPEYHTIENKAKDEKNAVGQRTGWSLSELDARLATLNSILKNARVEGGISSPGKT